LGARWFPQIGGPWQSWISADLLVGGFVAPGDPEALARIGVGAVVNVSHELYYPPSAFASVGISYLRVPCWDMRAPSLDDAAEAMRFIARAIGDGKKVYVHCASGVGRSVAVAVCYLATHDEADVEATLARIVQLRPRVSLSAEQRAFIERFVGHYRR
jgi:protein-tyrosine phosphatase